MKTVFLEAFASGEYGRAPAFAQHDASPDFCARLQELNALCAKHGFTEVRVSAGPDAWGPGDAANALRLTMPELVVAGGSFWFSDHPLRAPYDIQTLALNVNAFCEAVTTLTGPVPLFFASDVDALQAAVADAQEATLPELASA